MLGFKTQGIKLGICLCNAEILYFTVFTVAFIYHDYSNVPAAVSLFAYKHAVKVRKLSFASPFLKDKFS